MRSRLLHEHWHLPKDPVALGAAGVLCLCLISGGASQRNVWQVALLELAALPLLAAAISRLTLHKSLGPHKLPISVLLAFAAIPLIQLVPLPADLWRSLPGRRALADTAGLAGTELSWLPVSLTPDLTWAAFLALIPPAAIFLAVLTLDRRSRAWLLLIVLIAVCVNLMLGAGQLAAGGKGPLYFYDITSLGSAVGFFANRNHLATLVLVSIPLTAGLLAAIAPTQSSPGRSIVLLGGALVLLAVVGVATTQSRAGVLLAVPAILLSLAVMVAGRRVGGGLTVVAGAIGVSLLLGMALVGLFALEPLLDRFSKDPADELRFATWPQVVAIAEQHLPTGAGIGSFDTAFRAAEAPEAVDGYFMNRAHNEYLEAWLEAGWLAAGAFALFLIWFVARVRHVVGLPLPDRAVAGAAAAAVALVLVHSVFDYPARTLAIAAVVALCCAILEGGSARSRRPHAT